MKLAEFFDKSKAVVDALNSVNHEIISVERDLKNYHPSISVNGTSIKNLPNEAKEIIGKICIAHLKSSSNKLERELLSLQKKFKEN